MIPNFSRVEIWTKSCVPLDEWTKSFTFILWNKGHSTGKTKKIMKFLGVFKIKKKNRLKKKTQGYLWAEI